MTEGTTERYEHKTIDLKIGVTEDEVSNVMNKMTNEGWQFLMTLDTYPPKLTFRRKLGPRDLTEGPAEGLADGPPAGLPTDTILGGGER